jgi:divinyl protochlorophyllide a 8-vinyl-reductase
MTTASGRVGPNAVTRLAEALVLHCGTATMREVFDRAGLTHHRLTPPTTMVDEADVAALHRALREYVAPEVADLVSTEAGRRTADYILGHRLPAPVKGLLRLLPPSAAASLLAAAIARHAWTFAGSGTFHVERGRPLRLFIAGGPIGGRLRAEAPVCAYCTATFAGLFRALVHPRTSVHEVTCAAVGAPECVFVLDWPVKQPPN